MTYDEVRALLEADLLHFEAKMKETLGIASVIWPVSYNQLLGKFTETIRDAVHSLGYKIYFEQYVSEYGYIDPLPTFDIMQYSVSLTVSGLLGPDQVYKPMDSIFQGSSFRLITLILSVLMQREEYL